MNRSQLGRALLVAFSAAWSAGAHASTPNCSSLPNPVYVMTADTHEQLLKTLGQKLRASTTDPITIVYLLSGSCTVISDVVNGTKITTNPSYVPSQLDVPGWDPTQPSPSCTIDPSGVSVDLGISALFVSACTSTPVPVGISVTSGPIETYAFAVPHQSTQSVITADEAYFVLGFGSNDQVMPWNDPSDVFFQTSTKASTVSLAASIEVPPAKWMGMPYSAVTSVLDQIVMNDSIAAEATLGVLPVYVCDQNPTNVTELAFRAYEQRFGYLPDSQPGALDKINVRDGHYVPWTPTQLLVNGANARVQTIIQLLLGDESALATDVNGLDAVIATGHIPDCAMKVTRSAEGGDLSLYTPAAPCGCYYDSIVATTSCTACTTSCTTGVCRHGFCEAN